MDENDTRLCGGMHSCNIACGNNYEPPKGYEVWIDKEKAHEIKQTN